MGVAENFSAKKWADNLISMAEGHHHHTEKTEVKVETAQFTAPASNNSMAIDNSFSSKSWVRSMLAKASFVGTKA